MSSSCRELSSEMVLLSAGTKAGTTVGFLHGRKGELLRAEITYSRISCLGALVLTSVCCRCAQVVFVLLSRSWLQLKPNLRTARKASYMLFLE